MRRNLRRQEYDDRVEIVQVDPDVTKPSGQRSRGADTPLSYKVEDPKYTFSDIVLNPATYDMIQDALTLYSKQDLVFGTWGLGTTHKDQNKAGINLYGPPGTGKTMAAHAIASQLGRQLLIVDYSQIESKYVGETSKNLTAMFAYAKESNAVLFFDEADALLSRRVTDMSSANDVSVNQTRSVLLTLINDYEDLILFATNFVSNYDPAFLRRILAHVKFDLPDEEGRKRLWRRYLPKQMPTDADISRLAAEHPSVTGSDISNAVLRAALRAARNGDNVVGHQYFDDAIEQSKVADETGDVGTCRVVRGLSEEYVNQQLGKEGQ